MNRMQRQSGLNTVFEQIWSGGTWVLVQRPAVRVAKMRSRSHFLIFFRHDASVAASVLNAVSPTRLVELFLPVDSPSTTKP